MKHELYESISHRTALAPYSIHYTELPPDCELALYLHWHDELEFLLLTAGEVTFHIEDKAFMLRAGDGIFIPPKLLHYATTADRAPVAFYAFVLSPEFLFSSFDTHAFNTYVLPIMHNNLSLATPLLPSVVWQQELLALLKQIIFSANPSEIYIRGLTLLLWDKLFAHHLTGPGTTKSLHILVEQLSAAITYIHSHYPQNLTLGELAACVHLSEGEFCRAFKRLTGMTPFHYIVRYRILQSCKELQSTNKKITDIAFSNGFNNISYYNRAFVKLMNMTPSEYRKLFN
ncbi:MAG: helix-turn-helix transcriptional regulator [Lachnospiraceae bacterium]|nr:helix-turn-helix transcriptional regulator [Lachnospiraceae bacterium]